jgi:ubiquinone/menaquinone biosynthesis C-methylase UbiE
LPILSLTSSIRYSIFVFKTRSLELEFIDTGDYTPEEYAGFMREIRLVNRFAGDAWALRKTLLKDIEREDLKEFSVLDVGAGSGELLRVIANFARKQGRQSELYGLDYNQISARTIREESKDYDEIYSVRGDALNLPFQDNAFDYAICSLFTHHLKDEMIVATLCEMNRVARRRVYVIDLHRHPVAYYFYITVGKIFLHNRLVRHDGALSILRSFKPSELENLARQAGFKNFSVTRHFPYRLVLENRLEKR